MDTDAAKSPCDGKKCAWRRTAVVDRHGLRQEQWTCGTCLKQHWSTRHAGYLGDSHVYTGD